MQVSLKALRPNPLRDFAVDPVDASRVEELKQSIKEEGFWGGVVCRQVNGEIQLAAGHHRIAAAIAAGIKTADLFVSHDMDDASMLRIYALENTTQRGNSGTALTGVVAGVVRFVVKSVLCGVTHKFMRDLDMGKVRAHLASEKGIGREVIAQVLDGVPGFNAGSINQQLANLKSSGHYARIVADVNAEIEKENREALRALAAAEKAKAEADARAMAVEAERKRVAAEAKRARETADRKRAEYDRQKTEAEAKLAEKRQREADAEMKKFEALKKTRDTSAAATKVSSKRDVTFDYEGVVRHLKNAHQVDVFRELVTGKGIAPYLPVNKQAVLAKAIVKHARDVGERELTGRFIRENITAMVLNARTTARSIDNRTKKQLEHADMTRKAERLISDFIRGCNLMIASGLDLATLLKKWPKGLTFPATHEVTRGIKALKSVVTDLDRRL